MPTVYYTGPTTSGQNSGTVIAGALPAFSGGFTITIAAPSVLTGLAIVNFTVYLVRSSDGATCWSDGLSVIHGSASASVSTTVGGFFGTWSHLDWDSIYLEISSAMGTPAVTWLLTVDGAGIVPPGICQYGTELKPGAADAIIITAELVATVVTAATLGTVWVFIFAVCIGADLSVAELCSSQRPPVPELDWSDLNPFGDHLASHADIMASFRALLWDYF